VGWFLHTPFPSSEIYRTLPVREEVLRAVLKADLIGFHTYDYARHFVSACTRILGLEARARPPLRRRRAGAGAACGRVLSAQVQRAGLCGARSRAACAPVRSAGAAARRRGTAGSAMHLYAAGRAAGHADQRGALCAV